RVELRGPDGNLLDYCINDRLAPVNQGAIVDNKRLGHVLQMAQEVQTMRDDGLCCKHGARPRGVTQLGD
ncbi:hypothetical protein K5E40_34610, partial [Pseudomonas baetica]|nr:hypothetical protein [Pseudomonas baetica]